MLETTALSCLFSSFYLLSNFFCEALLVEICIGLMVSWQNEHPLVNGVRRRWFTVLILYAPICTLWDCTDIVYRDHTQRFCWLPSTVV